MINFDKLIDGHLEREHKPKEIGRYYPSEIGKCMRKTWYSYLHPQEVDPELMKIFEAGNIIHNFIVEVLRNGKSRDVELVKSEMPVKVETKDFTISGRVDDLILVKSEGKMFLVEVKSTKNIKFTRAVDPSHRMQLQFYMHATGIRNGVVLYIDKTNLQTKAFEIELNGSDGSDILKRFEKLHQLLSEKELPEREATQSKDTEWMCRYCEYAGKCGKDEK